MRAAVGILAALLVAGGALARHVTREAGPLLRTGMHTIAFISDQAAPSSGVAQAARMLDGAVDDVQSARAQLDALANSPDPSGMLLTRVMCEGMSQVADWNAEEMPSNEDWRSFTVAEARRLSPAIESVGSGLDDFTTTMDLAALDPRAARLYLQACVLRPR